MAYAQLAETNQMVGMYTAVFPVALYTLLGPSRHVSMGEQEISKHELKVYAIFSRDKPIDQHAGGKRGEKVCHARLAINDDLHNNDVSRNNINVSSIAISGPHLST